MDIRLAFSNVNHKHLMRAITGIILAALTPVLMTGRAEAQNLPQDAEFQSYLAHIAAASSALRLHETAEAKRWLASAPEKYRNWEWRYLNVQAEQSIATDDDYF
jgi:hypothetical protein